ncbi:hypothetical protein DFJ73DRAFT_823761 [Zopfochytrium polystomum]|nr:hypothetical protein DFJ73DRAFT_823761 [Zopfochytrium polystomum]
MTVAFGNEWYYKPSIANKLSYARRHGYDLIVLDDPGRDAPPVYAVKGDDREREPHPVWAKVSGLRKHVYEYDWFLVIDADAFVANFELRIEDYVEEVERLFLQGPPSATTSSSSSSSSSSLSKRDESGEEQRREDGEERKDGGGDEKKSDERKKDDEVRSKDEEKKRGEERKDSVENKTDEKKSDEKKDEEKKNDEDKKDNEKKDDENKKKDGEDEKPPEKQRLNVDGPPPPVLLPWPPAPTEPDQPSRVGPDLIIAMDCNGMNAGTFLIRGARGSSSSSSSRLSSSLFSSSSSSSSSPSSSRTPHETRPFIVQLIDFWLAREPMPDVHKAGLLEQEALRTSVEANVLDAQRRVATVPLRMMNSYAPSYSHDCSHPDDPYTRRYREGDWIVHFVHDTKGSMREALGELKLL